MRTSCNGCRVLRKACNDDCAIRPSLDWIKSPDSQANATVFLAKFYGRAGLLNLVSSAPPALRSAIFKSLLYEACGRIVDPVHGSVGLMWSGQWHHCQAAVDAVLKGLPIMQLPNSPAASGPTTVMPLSSTAALKLCDIRHVSSSGRTRSSKPRGGAGAEEPDRSDQGESMSSNETVEPTLANRADPGGIGYPGLELTLGLGQHEYHHSW